MIVSERTLDAVFWRVMEVGLRHFCGNQSCVVFAMADCMMQLQVQLVVTKLAVCCNMITSDKAVTETFAEHGLQYGIGSPDGCLTASRLTQLVFEADPKHITRIPE